MDLVLKDNYFFPKNPEEIFQLPLDTINCYMNKYIVEKYLIINYNYITRTDEYPFLRMDPNNSVNISNNYLLRIHKFYELDKVYFTFQRKKMNLVVFINKSEQKLKDLNLLLFYLLKNNPHGEDSISVTIIITSFVCSVEFKPNCLFHDKPYHFYTDYCTKNKAEYEKFSKNKLPKIKIYNLNLYDVNSLDILIDLGIKPNFLPQFIFYDRNYRVIYKDNLFQETPENFTKICQQIYNIIASPFNMNKNQSLEKIQNNIKINTFFDFVEKKIEKGEVCQSKEEYNHLRTTILEKCLKPDKSQKKGKTCKIYFVIRLENLNKNFSSNNFTKIVYLEPIIFQCSAAPVPEFIYESKYIQFNKPFHNSINEYLNYTLKAAISFINNNDIKCEMSFWTKKKITNLLSLEKREFNVEYFESFENYYLPLNFKILFRDKAKFFSVNLFPKIEKDQELKLILKDVNDKDRPLIIKNNEITIIQYFREDLYNYQIDLGEKINELRAKYPNVVFKYYLLLLIPCDKFKNSIHYEKILSYVSSWKNLTEMLFFSYVMHDFKELTKVITNGPFIYIFDMNKQFYTFEVFPKDKKRIEEWFVNKVNYILNPLKWTFKINKQQYTTLKNEAIKVRQLNSEEEILMLSLNKQKFFDSSKQQNYFAEIIKFKNDPKLNDELKQIENMLKSIIPDSSSINLQ